MQPGAGRKPYRSRLRVDGEFYLDLQLCAEYHIPHSEFLSWEPEDRAKAVAFMLEKNERCQMCGTAKWEWDPDQGGRKFAYEAVEELCQGCLRKETLQESAGAKSGTSVILIPTGTVEYEKIHQRMAQRWREDLSGRGR